MRYLLALLLAGCAMADDGPCAPRSGTYEMSFERTSGGCPERLPQRVHLSVASWSERTSVAAPCDGELAVDGCAFSWDSTCPKEAASASFRMSEDWTTGEGTFSVRRDTCTGEYRATIRRVE